MKTGLVIYTSSIEKLATFYAHVFDMQMIESDGSYALLVGGDFELVLLETDVSQKGLSAFEARENTALKPTFFVNTPLEFIEEKIKAKGGVVFSPKNWTFGGRQVCDAHDCEGNIFQLRIGNDG